MDDMIPYRPGNLTTLPDGSGSIRVGAALEAFQRALDAGVQIAKSNNDAKTERALIAAKKDIQLEAILSQKETQIAQIEADTRRSMERDRQLHDRRMDIIRTINRLILENAATLTPEILEGAKILLQVLREER